MITSGVTPAGAADGSPVGFGVQDSSGTTAVPGGLTGEVGGVADLLTTTFPAYLAGLASVAKDLADQVNALHQGGYDAAGDRRCGDVLLRPGRRARHPVRRDHRQRTSSRPRRSPVGGWTRATRTCSGTPAPSKGSYQQLVSSLGVEVVEARRRATNQQAVTGQVDASREQLAGVDLDEEMVNLMSAQRAYEAASRVMTTVDSMLDTLINHTGLVR